MGLRSNKINPIKSIITWCKDPFRIDRDWDEFKKMSDEEVYDEYYKLFHTNPSGDRFRRLCQHVTVRWLDNYMRTKGRQNDT